MRAALQDLTDEGMVKLKEPEIFSQWTWLDSELLIIVKSLMNQLPVR